MKKMILFIMAMAICMGAIAAQSKETQEKTVSVSQFDKVSIAASFTVRYTQGPKHKCTIIASPEDMKKVKAEVKDKQLKIYVEGQKKDAIKVNGITFNNASIYGEVIVEITSPELTKVSCLGSGDFVATTDIKSEDLEFMISGSGNVKLKNVTADKLHLSIAGSGGIDMQQAQAGNLNVDIAGSGEIDINDVASCKKAFLSVAGSGDIDATFSGCQELACSIAGSGEMELKGKVVNYKSSVSGSGEITKKELVITGDCRENGTNRGSFYRKKPRTVNNINAEP